ncbi:MAG: dCMP deaminase family protein [Eubacteriales bacterium]|nr:dCMP deaminase family protein [Eubacteriales bacterium]
MDKWDRRFMELAEQVATWSSCFQPNRQIGAIIVKDKRIMTTGYNGAPAGVLSCKERQSCLRREMDIPSGQRAEFCYAIHAEQNAVIQAARMGISIAGATLYCTHQPCSICAKIIVNAGIARIVYRHPYPDAFTARIVDEAGVTMERYCDDSLPE